MNYENPTRNSRPASHQAPPQNSQRCRISAFRDETTGQYYALSHDDRIAYSQHCDAIVSDLQPANPRERWLANSIAEDQWRLNRARALESNIFAMGMSSPMVAIDIDSDEGYVAICHARTWLADGKKLQNLALYESRIRRSIEKNEKQLHELQAGRKAAFDKALEEEKLLAELALAEGETYVCEATPTSTGYKFKFSTDEILRLVRRDMRLRQATLLRKQNQNRPAQMPKAA